MSNLSTLIAKLAFRLPRGGYPIVRAAATVFPELREFPRKMKSFDYTMRCDLRESVFYPLAKFGLYPHTRGEEAVLSHLVRPDWIVLDVGANIGYMAAMFSRLCPSGRIYAFEPAPKCAPYITAVASDFPNVEFIAKACGAKSGVARIQQQAMLDTTAISDDGDIEVEVTTVDDWCAQRGVHPSFLKIDAEGFDESVIEGAMSTLRKDRPFMMFEANVNNEFMRIETKLYEVEYFVRQITAEGALREGWTDSATRNFLGFPNKTTF